MKGKHTRSSTARGRQKTTSWKPPKRESLLHIHSTKPKMGLLSHGNEENHNKTPREDPSHWTLPRRILGHRKKWRKQQKCEGECPSYLELCEEANTWVNEWLGLPFPSIYLAHKSKFIFPKMGAFPNTNLTAILFPSQGINYLNQFLEEINDWA